MDAEVLKTAKVHWAVSASERRRLVAGVPGFLVLSSGAQDALVQNFEEEYFPQAGVVIREGDAGNCLYLVAEGRAEVSIATPTGPVAVATLASGELFGEMALLAPSRSRQATVTALTPLQVLVLSRRVFERLLAEYPDARACFAAAAEERLAARFLKEASPFSKLDVAATRRLAKQLKPFSVPAGTDIIKQGETGDQCYLLRAGKVEIVIAGDEENIRQLAVLAPGALFGEAALLTHTMRTATVRALESCDLLVLERSDLLEALGANRHAGAQVLELLGLRSRPLRINGVLAQELTNAGGEPITVLKDPRRGAYYRLSIEGWFLWQRLDGHHTLKDLTMEYFAKYKLFAPQAIAETVGGLAAAGFVEGRRLREDVTDEVFHRSGWRKVMLAARGILEWRAALTDVDGAITRAYRGGVYLIYVWPVQVILAGLALLGLIAFAFGSAHVVTGAADEVISSGALLSLLVPALLFSILIHEAGHAFTVKAFGRDVSHVGVGWYWFSPVCFVDTSDMWLASRWPRVAVGMAGPYANLVLAGAASLTAWSVSDLSVAFVLWEFALISYAMVLVNLNPLLEYDGYHVLADLLDRPNLRYDALAWVGSGLRLSRRGGPQGYRAELTYALFSLIYVGSMALLAVVAFRFLMRN